MTAILGGGLSGLSAAYYLLKAASQKITIIEGSNSLGGWIHSIKYPKEGFIFEKGPRTVRPRGLQGLNTLSLVEDLNLSHKILGIPSDHPTAKNRLLYVNKELHPLPSSIFALFKTCPPFTKPLILSAFKDLTTPRVVHEDESIYSFVERRFGKEVAEYAISSMICGICAGDATKISVKFLMAQLFDWEQKHGSVLKGLIKSAFLTTDPTTLPIEKTTKLAKRALEEKWSVWSLRDGLQQLTDALATNVEGKGAKLMLNAECSKIEFHGKEVTCVLKDPNGVTSSRVFDHVICSLPATTLSQLVNDQHPKLSKELSEIKSVTVAVVNVAFKGKHLKHNAFGFLVPPREKLPILGVIFDSCNFEFDDYTVLTVMMGGHWFEEYFGSSATEQSVQDTALEQISSILNINEKPAFTHASILRNCIPQYTIGHYDRVKRVMSYIKEHKMPLTVIGASYNGVGINDVIFTARTAVEVLGKIS
ncbi:protoporphyrinogen oxidase [Macrosteles quadrilineatus]|uniref:protoporphyrinogen oxidase n=1 Tax=Macrosteles quadrilineatus TaxID=74068 RepID=UPI0023E16327|nr:protoporphyrinogen oxidase [Macrosteles quadrilineatus]